MGALGLVVRDTLFFSIVAILLGYLIDRIYPPISSDETPSETFLLIIVQILLGALVIFLVFSLYQGRFRSDPDIYLGATIFVVIFFMVQTQLLHRLVNFYTDTSGVQLNI